MLLTNLIAQASSDIFGSVEAPPGVDKYNLAAGGVDNIGVIIFISRMIRLVTIVAGVFIMFNIIIAGYTYITAMGDSSAHGKVRDQITYSVIGLVIIIASYSAAGLIGAIFFGDATFILNPTLVGPEN